MGKRRKAYVLPNTPITAREFFRCPILSTRHSTTGHMCANRRINLELWPECKNCPVLLPGQEPPIIKPKRKKRKYAKPKTTQTE
jgi:hypothetical protein